MSKDLAYVRVRNLREELKMWWENTQPRDIDADVVLLKLVRLTEILEEYFGGE